MSDQITAEAAITLDPVAMKKAAQAQIEVHEREIEAKKAEIRRLQQFLLLSETTPAATPPKPNGKKKASKAAKAKATTKKAAKTTTTPAAPAPTAKTAGKGVKDLVATHFRGMPEFTITQAVEHLETLGKKDQRNYVSSILSKDPIFKQLRRGVYRVLLRAPTKGAGAAKKTAAKTAKAAPKTKAAKKTAAKATKKTAKKAKAKAKAAAAPKAAKKKTAKATKKTAKAAAKSGKKGSKKASKAATNAAAEGRRAVARGDRPPLKNALERAMGNKGDFKVDDAIKELTAKNWMPNTKNPREYIGYILSSNNDLFERVSWGVYRVKTTKAAAAPKNGKSEETKAKPAVQTEKELASLGIGATEAAGNPFSG